MNDRELIKFAAKAIGIEHPEDAADEELSCWG